MTTNSKSEIAISLPSNIVRSNANTSSSSAATSYSGWYASSTYSKSHPRPAPRTITKEETGAIMRLKDMLTYCRPEGSKMQRKFIKKFLTPFGVGTDDVGNCYFYIARPDGEAPAVLWSSHTDTVHYTSGRQEIVLNNGMFKVRSGQHNQCLGADCTTGVWLMTEMIRANVPGFYLFHTGEECGGIGSSHIANKTPELVRGFKAAIAFDRRATRSIITHQAGGRCCSDTFAQSLSAALGGNHMLDSGGSFTDTANYTDLIGECTNVSVGYFNEHSRSETQCVMTALNLRKSLLSFDEDALSFKREPGENDWSSDDFEWGNSRSWRRSYRGFSSGYADGKKARANDYYDGSFSKSKPSASTYDQLLDLVENNPEGVADYLETYGVDAASLEDHILGSWGVVRR